MYICAIPISENLLTILLEVSADPPIVRLFRFKGFF